MDNIETNVFEWTFMQEMILQYIQDEIDPNVTLGSYNHHVTNLHLYDFNGSQGYDVIENKLSQRLGLTADDDIEFPDIDLVHEFFSELVVHFSSCITGEKIPDNSFIMSTVDEIFDKYNVLKDNNILYQYANLVAIYIKQKRCKLDEIKFNEKIEIFGSEEFYQSIEMSVFRRFDITRLENDNL